MINELNINNDKLNTMKTKNDINIFKTPRPNKIDSDHIDYRFETKPKVARTVS